MSNLAQDISAIFEIYKESVTAATKGLIKNWIILPGTIAAYVALLFILNLTSGLGMVGGFIAGLFYVAFLTYFYGWVAQTIRKEKISLNSLKEFDWSLFSALISIGFIFWILSMLVTPFGHATETSWILACYSLGVFICFNAIPEIVFIKRYESIAALKYSFNFIKDNWIEWFMPFVILLAPAILTRPVSFLTALSGANPFSSGGDPLLPAKFIFVQLTSILSASIGSLGILLALIVTAWFMIFRGYLFTKLDGSSRRQRTYRSKFS